jgi:hypothetical protein
LVMIAFFATACLPPVRDITVPEGRIQFTDEAVTVSGDIAARVTSLNLANQGSAAVTPVILRLSDEGAVDSVVEALQEGVSSAEGKAVFLGGARVPVDETRKLTFNLRPGFYLVGDFTSPTLRYATFSVGNDNPSKGADPVGFVNVEIDDVSISMPESIASGAFTWEITNSGQSLHEMQILKLENGVSRRQVLESLQAKGEASAALYTVVDGWASTSPGQTAWIKLDLEPGNYLAVCLLPEHLDAGIAAEFEVK